MAHQFDELAKELASGISRREALRRCGAGLVGALLACVGLEKAWGQGISDCARFCQGLTSGAARAQCISDAAHGTGLCYDCGPRGNHTGLCGQTCCHGETVCQSGVCSSGDGGSGSGNV